VMAFPLVVRTLHVTFQEINPRLEVMARTLGHTPLHAFFHVTFPLAWKGFVAATILGFTRAMGEFGASVMLAGNIPGKTQTLASAIYSAQQAGNFERGNLLLAIALMVGFAAVFLTETLTSQSSHQNRVLRK